MGFTLQTYKNSVDVHVVRKYSVKRIQIYIYKHSLLSDIVEMKLSIFLMLSLAALSWADDAAQKKKEELGTVIGIDLGTTYSCVGVFKNGRVEIIANDQGNRITPSYVAFTAEGERLIGDAAKNQLTTNPENTVFDAKRLIGRAWNEPSVQSDAKFFPFRMEDKNGKPHVEVKVNGEDKLFAAEEISAMVLV